MTATEITIDHDKWHIILVIIYKPQLRKVMRPCLEGMFVSIRAGWDIYCLWFMTNDDVRMANNLAFGDEYLSGTVTRDDEDYISPWVMVWKGA